MMIPTLLEKDEIVEATTTYIVISQRLQVRYALQLMYTMPHASIITIFQNPFLTENIRYYMVTIPIKKIAYI